jgi:hypothetical protein
MTADLIRAVIRAARRAGWGGKGVKNVFGSRMRVLLLINVLQLLSAPATFPRDVSKSMIYAAPLFGNARGRPDFINRLHELVNELNEQLPIT